MSLAEVMWRSLTWKKAGSHFRVDYPPWMTSIIVIPNFQTPEGISLATKSDHHFYPPKERIINYDSKLKAQVKKNETLSFDIKN
jgi:hypothetical protein